jgi:hypothetical protein
MLYQLSYSPEIDKRNDDYVESIIAIYGTKSRVLGRYAMTGQRLLPAGAVAHSAGERRSKCVNLPVRRNRRRLTTYPSYGILQPVIPLRSFHRETGLESAAPHSLHRQSQTEVDG